MSGPEALVEAFRGLPTPDGTGDRESFMASSIDAEGHFRIAKDMSGNPVLLVTVPDPESSPALPPVRLRRLTVQHDLRALVQNPAEGEKVATARLTVIRCVDPELTEHFLRICWPIVRSLQERPSRARVSEVVTRLADLFQMLSSSARETAQGLWAELFIVAQAREPQRLVEGWHQDPEERFDFALGSHRLEVKSFSGPRRIHHFGLEQLRPPAELSVWVLSLQTVRSSGGASIAELMRRIQGSLRDPGAALAVEHIVAESLGEQLGTESLRSFDEEIAGETLRFYRAESLPSVDPNVPERISGVRFMADLEGLPGSRKLSGPFFDD
jgi:hypothetical protein